MDNTRLPKHALNYKPRGRRDRGRPGNDGNASMPEQVKRPNPWRKKMMMLMMTNYKLLHVDLMILYHQAGISRTLNTYSFSSCK